MADTTPTTPLDFAFDALRTVVGEYAASGRRPSAAGLKPALQRRTSGQFSENALGYASFRQFLNAAADAGYIRLEQGDQDVYAVPADSVGVLARDRSVRRSNGPTLLRPDFWRSLNDTRGTLEHWYDKAENKAVSFPTGETPLDRPEVAMLRRDTRAEPERYVRIEPATEDDQIRWMREFVDGCGDAPEATLLRSALETARPIATFLRLVKTTSHARAWHEYRVARIFDLVQRWAETHRLDIRNLHTTARAVRFDAIAPPIAEVDDGPVRERLKRAIDKMPLHELLKISLPVEYLL